MKNLIFVLALLIGCSFAANSQCISNFTITENGTAEFDHPEYGQYIYKLINKSFKTCDIKVIDRESGEFISGFGMGKRTTAEVNVPSYGKVVITNDSKGKLKIKGVKLTDNSNVNVSVTATNDSGNKVKASAATSNDEKYVQVNLINNSDKDISLMIPTVMNPNLLPKSKSGLSLKVGQKIYFKAYGKKYELLTVSADFNEGEDLNVSRLLKEKKYELGFY